MNYPLTPKEFEAKYSGCYCKETVRSIGKFGEIKYAHGLKVYNADHEIIYREWYICSD